MKRFIKSFFKNIDFLGPPVNVKIKGNDNLKTLSGGIFSLTIIFLTLGIIVYYLTNYLDKKNLRVTTITQIRNNLEKEEIPVRFLNTTILISDITEDKFQLMPLKIIDSRLEVNKYSPLGEDHLKRTKVGEVIRCTEMDYLLELKNNVNNVNYTNCIAYKYHNKTLTLSEDIDNRKLFSRFTTDLCAKYDKDSSCKNSTFLREQYLEENLFLSTVFEQTLPNMNVESGYKESHYMQVEPLDSSMDYILSITITKHIIYTKTGAFLNFHNEDKKIIYSVRQRATPTIRKNKTNYLTIYSNYDLDSFEYIYYRSYDKLDEICANIISLYFFIRFFFKSLLTLKNFGYLQYKISKKIYFIEENKFENKNKNKNLTNMNLNDIINVNNNSIKKFYNKNNIENSSEIILQQNPSKLNLNKIDPIDNIIDINNKLLPNLNSINNLNSHTLKSNFKKEKLNLFLKEKCNKLKYSNNLFCFKYFKCFIVNKNVKNNFKIHDILNKELDVTRLLNMNIEFENFRKFFIDEDKLKYVMFLTNKRFINLNKDNENLFKNSKNKSIDSLDDLKEFEEQLFEFIKDIKFSEKDIDNKLYSLIQLE